MSENIVLVTDSRWPDLDLEKHAVADVNGKIVLAKDDSDLDALLEKAVAVLNGFAGLPRWRVERMKMCRIVARWGIGVDNIDLKAATEAGIPVTNVPDYCVEEVSTHVLSLILAANRKLFALYEQSRAGGWGFGSIRPVHRLSEQIVGVVGYGQIGRAVAKRVAALGMNVMYYDPYISGDEIAKKVTLNELLRDSDYVTLHLPLNDQTRSLLGAQALSRMKPTAVLINAARGEVIDANALAEALNENRIGGALLDVLASEPPRRDEPLVKAGAVLTGHSAWYSEEALTDLRVKAVRQVVLALEGKPLEYPVNSLQ